MSSMLPRKASDIPDVEMIEIVRRCADAECSYPMESGWHGGRPGYAYDSSRPARGHWANWMDISNYLYPEVPHKIVQAKLSRLIQRGLIDGCPCGCRGDYEMTEKGRDWLTNTRKSMSEDR